VQPLKSKPSVTKKPAVRRPISQLLTERRLRSRVRAPEEVVRSLPRRKSMRKFSRTMERDSSDPGEGWNGEGSLRLGPHIRSDNKMGSTSLRTMLEMRLRSEDHRCDARSRRECDGDGGEGGDVYFHTSAPLAERAQTIDPIIDLPRSSPMLMRRASIPLHASSRSMTARRSGDPSTRIRNPVSGVEVGETSGLILQLPTHLNTTRRSSLIS